MHVKSLLKPLPAVLLIVSAQLTVAEAAVPGNKIRVDIPAMALSEALKALADQGDFQIVFTAAAVKDRKAPSVTGTMRSEQALAALLKGTELEYVKIGDAYVVRGKGAQQKNALPQTDATSQAVSTSQVLLSAQDAPLDTLLLAQLEAEGKTDTATADKKKKTKSGDGVEEMVVEEGRIKPFSDANVDLPRTINDPQPYYIFDSKTIQRSGAANIEEFLKQRLTMNTNAFSNSQMASSGAGYGGQLGDVNLPFAFGNTSTINLGGLGRDKTLILVNGRRQAGVISTIREQVSATGARILRGEGQPDLNGIPLNAIDRIEVLPSSASAIYGASAMGGVVNVILKRDFSGGTVGARYENAWKADAPARRISANYGTGFEGGKTQMMLSAAWADSKPILAGDRREIMERGIETLRRNYPSRLYQASVPWLGSVPNIASLEAPYTIINGQYYGRNLTLDDGTPLGSPNAHVPAGISPTTSRADLNSALLASAGVWNFDLPDSRQAPTGLRRALALPTESRSINASLRRQLLPQLELFAEFSYAENPTRSVFNNMDLIAVPGNAPSNPFQEEVYVRFPSDEDTAISTKTVSRSLTFGAMLNLANGWIGHFDYTRSESRNDTVGTGFDYGAVRGDVASGALNLFVDTLKYPINAKPYFGNSFSSDRQVMDDFSLRASGSLNVLPWGAPTLTAGLEYRVGKTPANYSVNYVAQGSVTPTWQGSINTTIPQSRSAASIFAETLIPLVKKDLMPLVKSLDLQIAGRSERFTQDTGTTSYNREFATGNISYNFLVNGQPYFNRATYASTNGTIGLKYQPVSDITLRISRAAAFMPPRPDQLLEYPYTSTLISRPTITDPKNGNQQYIIESLGGGNPNLKPENSKSFNAGIIWEPSMEALRGLRANVEYRRNRRFDAIWTLSAQQFIDQENTYPERVVRNANGRVTFVSTSYVNLFERDAAGLDMSLDYRRPMSGGEVGLRAQATRNLHLRTQYAQTLPAYNAVNFPSEGGAPKYNGNLTLSWETQRWLASWTSRYTSSYKIFGSLGGPYATQYGSRWNYIQQMQGGDTIPSQTYHDLLLGYTFGGNQGAQRSGRFSYATGLLDNVAVQLGVSNVFNTLPPLEMTYEFSFWSSPFGDLRLRNYWLNISKNF